MMEVESVKVVAAWISNYYLSQNRIALIVFSFAQHNYAVGQYFLK
jgi:hypothetical protein